MSSSPTVSGGRSRRALLGCLTLLAGVLLTGCFGAEPTLEPRHFFLLTVDTLRADHLGAYGYPRATSPWLDALADEGVLFETAIAQWPKTGPSFASLFTGQYPLTTGLTHKAALRLPEDYLTLPELLQARGFTTVAVVSNPVLRSGLGWSQGFDEYLQTWESPDNLTDQPLEYRQWINAPRVNELALPLLERHRGAERLFVWIHYSDPHAPYALPEGVGNPFLGDEHFTGDEIARPIRPHATLIGKHRELKWYVSQYDANIRLVDESLRQVLDRARRLHLLDDSLVVFTADHGESLGEHDYYFEHGRLPYNAGARVPLVLHRRGVFADGRRVEGPVELIDLYPTLRDLLAPGQEVAGLEGHSLMPLLKSGSDLREGPASASGYAFSQAGGGSPLTHFRSVQDAEAKLIYHPARSRKNGEIIPPRVELYDLREDPGETRNLVDERPEVLRRLHQQLRSWADGREWIRPPQGLVEEHGKKTLDALRALGYLQ